MVQTLTVRVAKAGDLESVREIFLEYAHSVPAGHICFRRFETELNQLFETYSAIFLAFDGSSLAGCIAVRPLDESACEMKRLYVRERWRNSGLGRRLIEEVRSLALAENRRFLRLDTLREFASAYALYQRMGFRQIPPYKGQGPEVICMELVL